MTLGNWRLSTVCNFLNFCIPPLVREPATPSGDNKMTQMAVHDFFMFLKTTLLSIFGNMRLQHIMILWTLFLFFDIALSNTKLKNLTGSYFFSVPDPWPCYLSDVPTSIIFHKPAINPRPPTLSLSHSSGVPFHCPISSYFFPQFSKIPALPYWLWLISDVKDL